MLAYAIKKKFPLYKMFDFLDEIVLSLFCLPPSNRTCLLECCLYMGKVMTECVAWLSAQKVQCV